MTPEEIVGFKVARLREAAGLSQAQLGASMAKPWSRQAVSAAEKGRRAFTLADLTAVAAALNVSTASLLPDEAIDSRRALEAELAVAERALGEALIQCADLRARVTFLRAQLDHYEEEDSDG
ncbi:helix-turn-helix transcriptional regulator [Streptomyces sp. NPDC088090]|uniref:helix-turn-helix transcriptional regulator n=1 Tax=Streptomyces sp. NPDC088090 TaxID=3365822 RepID=UPI00384A6E12